MKRIYLDNAATSWPKPPGMVEAVEDYLRHSGVAVGRGATKRGAVLQQVVDRCRLRVARLFNATGPARVVFTFSGTDALNPALHGLLRPGDHVITTVIEHNSVLRPLAELRQRIGIELTHVPVGSAGVVDPTAIQQAIRPRTRLVAISHVSNVTGAIQPVAEIAGITRGLGVRLLVDAAQSAGHLPIDMQGWGVDLLACSGHKGLLGPLGTGLLVLGEGVESDLVSVRQGGTGTASEAELQPESLPDKFEAGNHNAPGIVGLEASLAWLESEGVAFRRSQELQLEERLFSQLEAIAGVEIYGPRESVSRCGAISFNVDGFDSQEVAAVLDAHYGIECRAGLHCAPRIHQQLGTIERGGTARVSPGVWTTVDEIDATVAAIQDLAGA